MQLYFFLSAEELPPNGHWKECRRNPLSLWLYILKSFIYSVWWKHTVAFIVKEINQRRLIKILSTREATLLPANNLNNITWDKLTDFKYLHQDKVFWLHNNGHRTDTGCFSVALLKEKVLVVAQNSTSCYHFNHRCHQISKKWLAYQKPND